MKAMASPERIIGRSDEMRRGINEFLDSPLNVTPACAIYVGAPKAGKTTVLRATASAIEEIADDTEDYRSETIFVDCSKCRTRRDFLFEILRLLGHKKSQEIPSEKRKFAAYRWLLDEIEYTLKDSDTSLFIFAIDDIDSIDSPDTALENILYLDNKHGSPRVGFIATSTSISVIDNSHRLTRKYYTSMIHLKRLSETEYRQALELHANSIFGDEENATEAVKSIHNWGHGRVRIGEAIGLMRKVQEKGALPSEEEWNSIGSVEEMLEDLE